jgi:3-deoxy-D-manno-octulosonic-acid transferase
MRLLYSLFWMLALPLVLLRLWWRGRYEPGYRAHVGERLGLYRGARAADRPIWVHAVSVGETRAAQPLIEQLLRDHPGRRILLTHMTPTGRATGASLFAESHGGRVVQAYLPYDIVFVVMRFLRHWTPACCILMETEVWPNLVAACRRAGVPVALVNARLSEKSLRRGLRLGALMRDAAAGMTLVAAQTQEDAARIRQLGVHDVHVTGSVKFDVAVPASAHQFGAFLRQAIGPRKVLLCASTREGEEALLLPALNALDGALLLLVPRHPQRFDEVADLVRRHGLRLHRRSALSAGDAVPPDTDVLLGDSMGEMFGYNAACDLAFIGGSLLPLGGQNLIETAALGKPVLIGPHTFNFAQVTEEAVAAGAALRVADAAGMAAEARALLADDARRAAMGERAAAFAAERGGATLRTCALLRPILA